MSKHHIFHTISIIFRIFLLIFFSIFFRKFFLPKVFFRFFSFNLSCQKVYGYYPCFLLISNVVKTYTFFPLIFHAETHGFHSNQNILIFKFFFSKIFFSAFFFSKFFFKFFFQNFTEFFCQKIFFEYFFSYIFFEIIFVNDLHFQCQKSQ